jgi:crotonobetainyl-CoA:carnitine CoA-transferase CaiB-like acyl-CoA transferase
LSEEPPPRAPSEEPPQAPFADVRVLSFGAALSGNLAAMTLAELGADVVKIESPHAPDGQRAYYFPDHPRIFEPDGTSTTALFNAIARSVRGIALDMATEQGRRDFARLVAGADVVLENFRPGVLDRWGFDFAALCELNPRIVLLSMSGFGSTEPRNSYVCYGTTSAAFTGLSHRTPAITAAHQDELGAVQGAVAVLAALARRDATGEPVWIDQSQCDIGATAMGPAYLDALVNGARTPGSEAEHAPSVAPGSLVHGVFGCAEPDTWLALEIRDEADWGRLQALLATDGVDLDEPKTAAAPGSPLAEWIGGQRSYRAFRRLGNAGVPAGVVQRPGDIYRDPQLRQRGFVVEVTHPDLGTIEYPRPPYLLSRTPVAVRRPAPRLGQHNDEILGTNGDTVQGGW